MHVLRALRLRSRAWRRFPAAGIAHAALSRSRCWRKLRRRHELESRAARLIMATAVEAPIRQLLKNAGYDPSEALAQLASPRDGRRL